MRHGRVLALRATSTLALALFFMGGCTREPPQVSAVQTCVPQWTVETGSVLRASLPTDSGMHGLWDPEAFRSICDFDSWAREFLNDESIEKHIVAGAFVPIYVHADGRPLIEVRIGSLETPARFSDEVEASASRRSKLYLFVSHGVLGVSGVEYIGGGLSHGARAIELKPGRWQVEILEVQPRPTLEASAANRVPNFVALVNPESQGRVEYRRTVETFE